MNNLRLVLGTLALGATLAALPACESEKEDTPAADAGTDAGTQAGIDAGADAGTDAGTEPQPFTSFSDFEAARINATCEYAVRCGAFSTVQGCEESALFADLGIRFADLAASVKDGRATFDGVKARACVDALASASCTDFEVTVDSADCQAAVEGTVAIGGDCFLDADCVNGAWCDEFTAGTCPAKCVDQVAAGEAPVDGRGCEPGLYLGADGTCEAPVAVGGNCSGGGFLSPPKQCVAGAYCDSNMICRQHVVLGETCETDRECAAPLACRGGTCSFFGDVGASCSRNPYEPCRRDLMCDAASYDVPGTCAVPRTSGACFESAQCANGYFCRGGSCAPPNAIGAACTPFTEGDCADDAYCASATNTCQPRAAVGGTCTEQGACVEGAYCDETATTCKLPYCADPTP